MKKGPPAPQTGIIYLTLVSCIWAFSFGLIKTYLAGIPAPFLAFLRLALAALIFLPWLQWKGLSGKILSFGILLGAIQYGLMYCLLFSAFRFLQAHEVVLFTLLTPLYVTLLGDLLEKRGLQIKFLLSAGIAVAGAAIIKMNPLETSTWWIGFLIMQGANACFAGGQVAYRQFKRRHPEIQDHRLYGWIFLGGMILAGGYNSLLGAPPPLLQAPQIGVILYLGIVASGLGFFWWNRGAALVANTGLLAVFNNLSIPLGVLVSIFVFGESTDWLRLLLGSLLLILSLYLASPSQSSSPSSPSSSS